MNRWQATTETESYKSAATTTWNIDEPSVGFSKATGVGSPAQQTAIKQNNFLIQEVTRISEELREIKEDVGEIKRAITELSKAKGAVIEGYPKELLEGLENLKNLKIEGKTVVPKEKGPFYVHKDPSKILQEELAKIRKMSRRNQPPPLWRPTVTTTNNEGRRVPSQEDQIRQYSTWQRNLFNTRRRIQNRLGRRGFNQTLETQIDPDREIQMTRSRRANLIPAEVLYSAGDKKAENSVYQHYSEERVLVTDGDQVELEFCNDQSYVRLVERGLEHLHMGVIMIRLQTLHRARAGTQALVILRDTRWSNNVSIIGSMEVDLSSQAQMVYIAPNMMVSLSDF